MTNAVFILKPNYLKIGEYYRIKYLELPIVCI